MFAQGESLRSGVWRRRLRRTSYVLLTAVLVAFYVKSVHSILDGTDGYDFYVAARAVVDGQNPREVMLREINQRFVGGTRLEPGPL